MIFFTAVILSVISVYCINGAGFTYPPRMPEPKDSQNAVFLTRSPFIKQYETPIQIRFTSILTQSVWNCLAVYHPTAFDAITKARPQVPAAEHIIERYGNEYSYWLCAAYALLIVDKFILPNFGGTQVYIDLMNSIHLDFDESVHFDLHPDVKLCSILDTQCLRDVAYIHNWSPEIMGSIVAYQSINYLENDGWNQNGKIGADGNECTANCRSYSDTTGYKPNFNLPYSWKPLVEDNGMGFFYHYDHVTPHIGFTAKPKVITEQELINKVAPDPRYKYDIEMDLVIDRLADLAVNDTQKMLVEFFDDKLRVATSQFFTLETELNWSYEERQLYLVGVNAAEYDSVLLAWKEKVRYDLIRPTSIIKRQGNGNLKLTTYAGPYQGLKEINSRDFEAYHRVMPHAEYPSGSGCICQSRAQFVDRLLKERYNRDSMYYDIPMFDIGSSIIEPGKTPITQIESIRLPDLTAMYEMCGETRLMGGMHFTQSVQGSYDLCDGLGDAGYDYVMQLLDGEPLLHRQ